MCRDESVVGPVATRQSWRERGSTPGHGWSRSLGGWRSQCRRVLLSTTGGRREQVSVARLRLETEGSDQKGRVLGGSRARESRVFRDTKRTINTGLTPEVASGLRVMQGQRCGRGTTTPPSSPPSPGLRYLTGLDGGPDGASHVTR